MRRSTVFLLTMAVIAATLGFASAATAVDSAPAPTATPTSPVSGQSFSITGNIGTVGSRPVELQRLGSTWAKYKSGTTTSSGDYSFTATTAEPERTYRVHAPATSTKPAVDSEPLTVTTVPPSSEGVAPTGPIAGKLTESPTTYGAGEVISITANFPKGRFPITLYREDSPDTWVAVATRNSNSSGDATFSGFSVTTASQRVFARKTNNTRTEVDTITPSPVMTLSIQRDCAGNDCATAATARGVLDPVEAGRSFTLQRLSGTSWVPVGSPGTTGDDGTIQIPFSLSGVPQWTARAYRLSSAATAESPAVTSRQIQFMPGPTQLGKNVLRVDVDKGVFPTSKANEYTGKATLSVDGTTTFDHVALEKFGVRGTSTAGYTKKPYKLKFAVKPPKGGAKVFGMARGKSWTLLASYLDQSFVRDKVGLDLGRRIAGPIPWTPDSRFVELFVNDQYRGSYLMTESVKIDGDRVDVGAETGMIMEVDNAVGRSSIGFTSSKGVPIVFKDPDERKTLADGATDPEGVTTAKLTAVKNRVNAFETQLYSSSSRSQYAEYLDEAAAIDFQFIKEFTKDNDADFNSSHYFAWDPATDDTKPLRDGTFHFGPAWDFDRSAGNVDPDTAGHTYMASPSGWVLRGTGTPSDSGRQLYKTHWFVQLFKDAGFNAAVKARWAVIRGEFKKVGDSEVAQLKTDLGVGAENDRHRWASEPKRYKAHSASGATGYDGEIAYVTKWYTDRYAWMDKQLS